MHYSIQHLTDDRSAAILDATLRSFEVDREMQSDLAKLDNACCRRPGLISLVGAPMPTRLETPQHLS